MKIIFPSFKTNPLLVAGLISVGILIIITAIFPKKKVSSLIPAPSIAPGQIEASPYRPELINLTEEKRRLAAGYVSLVNDRLPIYIENFKTSTKIDTTIHIYRLDSDPSEIVRFEIYGVSYVNNDPSAFTNLNVPAFKESYLEGLARMKAVGIDPKQLIFVYGDKEYVRKTATSWVEKLKLFP